MLSENRVLLSKALDFLSPLWRMVKPLVPRSSTSSLLIIAFTVSYLSVFITPILSGIVQDISFSDPLCIVLFLCDFGYFCDFLRYWRETSQSDDNSGDQLSNDKQQRYFQFFVHTLSFSNLFLVPIGVVAGVKGSDLAWISILRMVSEKKEKRKLIIYIFIVLFIVPYPKLMRFYFILVLHLIGIMGRQIYILYYDACLHLSRSFSLIVSIGKDRTYEHVFVSDPQPFRVPRKANE